MGETTSDRSCLRLFPVASVFLALALSVAACEDGKKPAASSAASARKDRDTDEPDEKLFPGARAARASAFDALGNLARMNDAEMAVAQCTGPSSMRLVLNAFDLGFMSYNTDPHARAEGFALAVEDADLPKGHPMAELALSQLVSSTQKNRNCPRGC